MTSEKSGTKTEVTVLVMFYNHEKFASETIKSILQQEGVSLQLIITDDCSTDNTRQVIYESTRNHQQNNIKFIFPDKNIGLPRLFSEALKHVSGEFFVQFGGDDIMLADKLKTQVQTLRKNPLASACYHDARAFNSESGETLFYYSSKRKHVKKLPILSYEAFLDTALILPQCLMLRSNNILESNVYFDTDYAFDILFSMASTRSGPIIPLNSVLTDYRRHENSITASPNFSSDLQKRLSRVYEIAREKYPSIKNKVDRAEMRYQAISILRQLKNRINNTNAADSIETSSWTNKKHLFKLTPYLIEACIEYSLKETSAAMMSLLNLMARKSQAK